MGKKQSVLTDDLEHCYFCGRPYPQIHHIFGGRTGRRENSEKDGFILPLCMDHHTGDHGIHFDQERTLEMRKRCQIYWERDLEFSREDFIHTYGRSYL